MQYQRAYKFSVNSLWRNDIEADHFRNNAIFEYDNVSVMLNNEAMIDQITAEVPLKRGGVLAVSFRGVTSATELGATTLLSFSSLVKSASTSQDNIGFAW